MSLGSQCEVIYTALDGNFALAPSLHFKAGHFLAPFVFLSKANSQVGTAIKSGKNVFSVLGTGYTLEVNGEKWDSSY